MMNTGPAIDISTLLGTDATSGYDEKDGSIIEIVGAAVVVVVVVVVVGAAVVVVVVGPAVVVVVVGAAVVVVVVPRHVRQSSCNSPL